MGTRLRLKPVDLIEADNWHSFQDDQDRNENRWQPWKAFWPPNSTNSENGLWRTSEFPEATSWKFDSTKPFDRPWRMWTRTPLAKSEGCDAPLETQELIKQGHRNRDPSQLIAANMLDELINQKNMESIDVASFNYLAPCSLYEREKPYLSRLPALPGFTRTNIVGQSQPVSIHNISGHEDLFKLDECGFEFTNFPESVGEWSGSSISSAYIPLLRLWLKNYLKCEDVYVYAYSFRGNSQGKSKEKTWKTPFFRAHCDATAASCSRRLSLYLPPELKQVAHGKRVRFLNVWRPLTTPFQDSPLAFCDSRTVSSDDLVATDIIFPHYLDEAYEVLYNLNHRWFYKQGMEDGEVIVFKLADSAAQVANLCPHAAFMDPSVPEGTPERASVEVRVIVIG